MSKEKIIVTGGAGFIGSKLVPALISRGFDVHVIDNLSAGKREWLPKEATMHEVDIRNIDDLYPIFSGTAYVFHLAALPRVQYSIDYPAETHEVNISGTFNVLLASKVAGVKKVIYSASSSAYGDQPELPLRETMPANPKSPYALQKYVGEQYCRIFSHVYGLPTVCLRYFNVYGLGADPTGPYAQVIPKFIEQLQAGKPMTITGDGSQSRDLVNVRDVVEANILAMESLTATDGEVINIGTGRNVSVNEIADMIGGPRVYIEARLEPKDTRADNTKAMTLLGWVPAVTMEEGIAELKAEAGVI